MRIAFVGGGGVGSFLGCWGRFEGCFVALEDLGDVGVFWGCFGGVGGALSRVWGVLKV